MVAGTRPGSGARRPVRKVSNDVRHCTVCGERLSGYNPGPNCFVHSSLVQRREPTVLTGRTAKPATVAQPARTPARASGS